VVIRDYHFNFMLGVWHCFTHVADAEGVELMACEEGLILAKEVPWQSIVLETDNVEVASKISKERQDRSSYGPLFSEIKALASELWWVLGTCNVADCKWSCAWFSKIRLR
jgi:ribonuclease HI